MGGIAGIVHFRGPGPDRDQALQLSAGVAHRGSDDKGLWGEEGAVLVHRRRTMDLKDLKQPAVTDTTTLVLDGRIWQGSDELQARWDRDGVSSLASINGPFALAVWERKKRVLWLARGPVGTRPLFYVHEGDRLAFSSEVAPMLRLPWVSRELARENLAEFLVYRYVHAPRTLIRSVSAVPPGHVVRVDRSGVTTQRWWMPRWASPGVAAPNDAATAKRVDEGLARSVGHRLRGGPVGVLLSGGLDSSAILYHAQQSGSVPPSFTVTFEGESSAEAPIASRVANVLGSEHQLVRLGPSELFGAIETCTQAMGAPLPGPAALVQYLLFKELRQHVRVLLSGDGGDEVLGGRGMSAIAAALRVSRNVSRLPGPAVGITRRVARRVGFESVASNYAHFGLERGIGGANVFDVRDRVAILRDPALVRPGIRETVLEQLYQQVNSDPLNEILHVRQMGWLCEDTLARSDRMASHSGLEIRYPMLDIEMLRLLAALPGEVKVRRRGPRYATKWPLRVAMKGRLPGRILNRPKRAFPSPLDRWLRTFGAHLLLERTEAICADPEALFDPERVRQLLAQHRAGTHDHAVRLWTLVFFHAWRTSLRR